jgi:hypothetical protein
MGYTGEPKWCPEASSRGDAKRLRRRAGPAYRARTGGAKSPGRKACSDSLAVLNARRLRLRLGGQSIVCLRILGPPADHSSPAANLSRLPNSLQALVAQQSRPGLPVQRRKA